jgi:F-box-like
MLILCSMLIKVPSSIPELPVDILIHIVGYLYVKHDLLHEISESSAADLARASRVSRMFYSLCMPVLWKSTHIFPRYIRPQYRILNYPGTSCERVLPFTRDLSLYTDPNSDDVDGTTLNRHWKYVSRCLRLLSCTTSLRTLDLLVYIYNVAEYPSELR